MTFRAVNSRCAVRLQDLRLPLTPKETIYLLNQNGFKIINVDLLELARQCVARSKYQRGARSSQAPALVDCSSFVKWLYGQRGIWLPRRSIQQREFGQPIALDSIREGDLVFTAGRINYYFDDPRDGVGHVGIATNCQTIIHAANRKAGVIESPLNKFTSADFRGARRYIACNSEVLTLAIPPNREVESSDDIRWIILQSLPALKP